MKIQRYIKKVYKVVKMIVLKARTQIHSIVNCFCSIEIP